MLPRKSLVPLKKEFERIRASGKMYDSPSFGIIVAYQADSGQPLQGKRTADSHSTSLRLRSVQTLSVNVQAAFIVSKKIDKRSVVRHDVKRKLSDAVSPFLPRLPKNLELVFLAKKNATMTTREDLHLEIEGVLKRARLLQ